MLNLSIQSNPDNPYRIAIIGLGPKGLYGLERAVSTIIGLEIETPVEIHIFNKTNFFGSGDVYRTDQPSFLLMNYANQYIDMWARDLASMNPSMNHFEKLTFSEWLVENKLKTPEESELGYSPRAVVGKYLADGFDTICRNLPENITIRKHVSEVVDLENYLTDIYLTTLANSNRNSTKWLSKPFQQVLLTTGHQQNKLSSEFGKSRFISFVYPVSEKLACVGANDSVAVKGLGLTFVDTVLALTEGKGGLFVEGKNGKLVYKKSGNEPKKIFPFSRTGLHMIPRKAEPKTSAEEGKFFNRRNLEEITAQKEHGKWDFNSELLPLIQQEFVFAYYQVLFKNYGLEMSTSENYEEIESQISNFHRNFPKEERFEFTQLFQEANSEKSDRNESVIGQLKYLISESEKGTSNSSIMKMASVWRELSELFNEVYSFGGLLPESQKQFLEEFSGHFNRIAYGPPIENMKKIVAIAEAGLIDFSFSENPEIIQKGADWEIGLGKGINQKTENFDWLIDARIPKTSIQGNFNPLYRNLIARGIATPFNNSKSGTKHYEVGCISIDLHGNPVNEGGKASRNITVYGTPTEGITYDNDTLSRTRNDFSSCFAERLADSLSRTKERNKQRVSLAVCE